MNPLEIVLSIIGVILTLSGYAYAKIGESKKSSKTARNYVETVGICKKHVEKNGKYHEQFEIIHEGKKLKYDFPSQKSKDKLRPLDSIEKFYISKNDHESIMTAKDLASKIAPLEAKRRHVSYAVMGVGLVCILVVLAMLVR